MRAEGGCQERKFDPLPFSRITVLVVINSFIDKNSRAFSLRSATTTHGIIASLFIRIYCLSWRSLGCVIDNLYTREQSTKTPWCAILMLHQTLFNQAQKICC